MKKFAFLVLAFVFLAHPAEARSYEATYDVYAGGIHALQTRITYEEAAKGYDVNMSSETYGLLNKLVPWHAVLSTKGKETKNGKIPSLHMADTTTRSKHEINTFKYDENGEFLNFRQVVDGNDVTRKDLDPSIYKGTIDEVTAVFKVADQIAAGNGCESESMLFDSERSYRLTFKTSTKDNLKPNKYSSFEGEAQGCTVEVKPEGGKWHKKPRGWLKIQEQAKKNGQLPTIWFANLSKTDKPIFAPVKVMIKTDYGVFIAHLTSFQEK